VRNYRSPFSILSHLEIFKKLTVNHGRRILDRILITGSEQKGRRRIFDPMTTAWLFVLQTLDADQSCRQAVSRFLVGLAEAGDELCSLKTGAYCRARKRLSEDFLREAVRRIGKLLSKRQNSSWMWKGREVKVIDGMVVSMPDTISNQNEYPQYTHQKSGVGFPQARLLVVFSLSTGALLEAVIGRVLGKGSGEVSLLRTLRNTLKKGEVLLFDRLYTNFVDMSYYQKKGIDFAGTLHIGRHFRSNIMERLGNGDWLVCFHRPPKHMLKHGYKSGLPDVIIIRVTEIEIRQKGFRTQRLTIASSFVDDHLVSKEEIASLYRQRWHAELDIRRIKATMQMDILRCKTPEMIRKEIWAHLLAYNLTCAIINEAAEHNFQNPNQISFKSALQLHRTIVELLQRLDDKKASQTVAALLAKLKTERVANRPNRIEPRAVKRRPKDYPRLMKPRKHVKHDLLRAA
jgi:hypothetical protein